VVLSTGDHVNSSDGGIITSRALYIAEYQRNLPHGTNTVKFQRQLKRLRRLTSDQDELDKGFALLSHRQDRQWPT
jgi:hypothetical protein